MATYTTNLNLKKPAQSDKIRIADINNNMDDIDAAFGAIGNDSVATQIGNIQDALAIVAVGDSHAAVTAGQFVYVRSHETLDTGLYVASANIAQNGALSSSNLTADTAGGLNALNSNINSKLVYKAVHVSPSDTTNKIYDTGVKAGEYFYIGAFTPFDDNIEVRMTNMSGANGTYRYTLWDTVTNTKITSGYSYWVYCAFLSRSGLKEIT